MPFAGLMLAAPGAGKGTQGQILADRMNLELLSSGDLLREHVARRDDIGRRVTSFMETGALVPDDLVVEMMLHHLDRIGPSDGFVLDGFPRTVNQAERLDAYGRSVDKMLQVVIALEVPDDELVRRLLERGRETGRSDDTESVIRHRLKVYDHDTAPLRRWYDRRGILHSVDGLGSIDDVAARVWDTVQHRDHDRPPRERDSPK